MPMKNALVVLVAAAAAFAAQAEPPVRAVVITGDHPFTLDTFLEAFADRDGIDYTHAPQQNHEEIFDSIADWPYDVMIFYHFSMEIPPHRLQNLLALIEQGVGLVVMHHGGMTYWNVEELRDVYGIRWNPPDFVFHMDQEYTARIADPDHPITHGLEDFQVHDETYTNFQVDDYPGNHTLITADHPNSDKVIAWTRHYGRTRVAGFQLGHDTPVFSHAAFQTIMARMTLWAAGRLPDELGGPVLQGTTIYRENRDRWVDDQILTGRSGVPQLAHDEIHRRVLAAHNDNGAREALALRLATLLGREGTADGKRFILRQLAYLRAPEAVPAIARLLTDPELGDMARGTLEDYPGESVDRALVEALPGADGAARIGLLDTLARRGEQEALEILADTANDGGPDVSMAALDALAAMNSIEADEALLSRLRDGDNRTCGPLLAVAARSLECGDRDRTVAVLTAVMPAIRTRPDAMRCGYYLLMLETQLEAGLELAAAFVTDPDAQARMAAYEFLSKAGVEGSEVLARTLPNAAAEEQVVIVAALGRMIAPNAAPAVRMALRSPHEAVRTEAARAMATLGGESDVAQLFAMAMEGSAVEAKAARAALASMHGIGAALAQRTEATNPEEAVLALETLAARMDAGQLDAVLARLDAADPAVRGQAWVTAGLLTTPGGLGALQSRMVEDDHVPAALAAVARKADNIDGAVDILCDYPYDRDGLRALALTAVAQLATEHAMARLKAYLDSPSEPLQEAALGALIAWPTPAPAPSLLAFAQDTSNTALREKALRSYIGHTELDGSLTPAAVVARVRAAYALAGETATRKAALEAAGRSGHVEGLALLREAMDDDALKPTAMRATLRLASLVAADHPDQSLESLRHVVESAQDEGFRAEASAALVDVEQYRGKLLAHWSFALDEEGWRAENHCTMVVEDGVLKIHTTGEDPHIVVDTHVPAGPAVVKMRAQFDVLGAGQFFWVYDNQSGYGLDSPFAVFELMQEKDGWVDFEVPINFERPIKSFRLDPGMETDGTVLVDYLRIERAGE